MSEIKLTVHPFEMGEPKEAAVKVLEEAAESFGAWQMFQGAKIVEGRESAMYRMWRLRLANEIADTIQAACNLAARYDLDIESAMERCEQRNRDRGRYEVER
jgi:phosphoribosyl-ATP pyrophosphohydrolase